MSTTYDRIYQTFLNNCKVSDIDLPSTDEGKYEMIKNAVLLFNNRLRTEIKCDDLTESVSEELNEDYLLIIAHYIRYSFLLNERTFFESLWQPFEKDVGLKNFSSQLTSLKNSVSEQERLIDRLIMNTEVDFL
ncbi:hypothetical protein [Heyndrickxia camelliae]|uniref:Uncharacterized protein n=1 Tax=Heyndrickxia camelliae TaxID=1707093 RepID=A0A2N3LE75_9BACI|nr:hypothetical protein [Heyndrickxia camelliae]PKR82853.1 hypothetical protein CWO92_21930 [Heyndrickxia camelliae]